MSLVEKLRADVEKRKIIKRNERDKRHKLIESLSKDDKVKKIIEHVLDCREEITRNQYAEDVDFDSIESMLNDILKATEGL